MPDTTSPDYHGLWSNLTSDSPDADIAILGIPFDHATSFRKGAAAVYFTLDVDGLDPAHAPEAGGVSMRDLIELTRIIFDGLPIPVMDIVEVAPPLDHNDITSLAAIRIIYEVFGSKMA
jgi:arginase family enzyme